MSEGHKSESGRTIDTSIEIAAPAEAVWRAVTEPRELERWFPLEARVTPGEGGEIFMSWGAPWEGSSRIEVWEPGRRLRTRGFLEHGDASMIEYTLETRGGRTSLRLVHSGFASGGDWEDELFGGTARGWRYELRSLRHYLERHAGMDRRAIWPKVHVSADAAEAWRRVTGERGLRCGTATSHLREGDAYRFATATDDVFEGAVLVNDPPFEFAGTVAGLADALVSLRVHDAAGPRPEDGHSASLWLSTWGVPAGEVDALRDRWQACLGTLFREPQ